MTGYLTSSSRPPPKPDPVNLQLLLPLVVRAIQDVLDGDELYGVVAEHLRRAKFHAEFMRRVYAVRAETSARELTVQAATLEAAVIRLCECALEDCT